MTYSELYKALKKGGSYIVGEGSRHQMWHSPITGKTFPVGRHKTQEVPKGTLKSIKQDAGLD